MIAYVIIDGRDGDVVEVYTDKADAEFAVSYLNHQEGGIVHVVRTAPLYID